MRNFWLGLICGLAIAGGAAAWHTLLISPAMADDVPPDVTCVMRNVEKFQGVAAQGEVGAGHPFGWLLRNCSKYPGLR
jgi:hypothetical protein